MSAVRTTVILERKSPVINDSDFNPSRIALGASQVPCNLRGGQVPSSLCGDLIQVDLRTVTAGAVREEKEAAAQVVESHR